MALVYAGPQCSLSASVSGVSAAYDMSHDGADVGITQVRGRRCHQAEGMRRVVPVEEKLLSGLEGPTTATDGCINRT